MRKLTVKLHYVRLDMAAYLPGGQAGMGSCKG